MKVTVEMDDVTDGALASAVVDEMERRGMVMVAPERVEPYSAKEAAAACRVSIASCYRLAEAGLLKRVAHTGRWLVTAASVREFQTREAGK